MTCGDQLTHDLKVINPRNGTLDLHSHMTTSGGNGSTKVIGGSAASEQQQQPQPKPHGFISLVFTTALCKNIHSSWNSLIKKHLNEDRFVELHLLEKYIILSLMPHSTKELFLYRMSTTEKLPDFLSLSCKKLTSPIPLHSLTLQFSPPYIYYTFIQSQGDSCCPLHHLAVQH